MATKEVRSSSGRLLGHVVSFLAPRFSPTRTNYTAVGLDGKTIGMAQPTKEAAIALLKHAQV